MDRKDTRSSEEEDDREELERLESDVLKEEVQKEVRGMHESGKEENYGEAEGRRDEYPWQSEKERK